MTISDDSDDILHSGSGIKNIVIIDMTDMVGRDEVSGMRNIQISEELFIDIVKYFLLEQEEGLPEIRRGLEQKMDALAMRELYTKYKTAPSEADREKARREYLDRRGVPQRFRW